MPRSEAQNEVIRAATREKLQAAAITMFTRKGFAATSVGDIAGAAGVSVGLMYRHYRTKEDLFGDLVEQAATGLERAAALFRTEQPAAELILAFATEFLDDLAAGGATLEFYLLLQQAVLKGPDDPRIAVLLDRHEALHGETVRLIERGQRDGTFRDGPAAALADLFYATLGGLAQLRLIRGDRFSGPSPELLTTFLIKEPS
ncbi:TetR/AcrR family transcriptional regulator [Microlunatus parietis]|uniref:AcrR family transcriptional regulator n=1 Tax=Microlunatus parietis TaxID=682979 RepID=A0A7Y9IEM7_9ACTN|nr:TetR/AcrR family transcriptional regulator [Microlunatus parietis]NYE75322.1 AcrR family transcriptional regulator [Microlunatus parietis]